MGTLLLQCRDEEARRRVEDEYALAVPHEWCHLNEELVERGRADSVLGVVLDTSDQRGRSTASAVRRLREMRKDLPVLLWCGTADSSLASIGDLTRAGVDAVVFRRRGAFEQRALAQFFPRESFPYQVWLEQAIERQVPPDSRPLVRVCLDPANITLDVGEIARRLGRSRRTLAHQLRKAHLPPAAGLLVWGRLLAAVWELANTHVSVERLAHTHGFASASSLRVALKRRTTDLPHDLRGLEGFTWVLRCFEHELSRQKRRGAAE